MSDFCMSFRRKSVGPLSVLLSGCQFGQFVVKKNSSNIFSPSFSDMNRKLISLYWSFFGQVDETAFYKSEGSIRRQTLALKILYVFSSFSDFERTINGVFCRKTNSSFVKTDYHLSRRFVEQIFLRIGFFCSPLKLERIFSWHSDKNFSAVSSKLLSVCPLQHFMVKIFSVKNVFLPSFSDIQRKFVKCFLNVPVQLDETAFYESGGSIWGHNFALTKFLFVFFSCSSKLEQRIIGFFSSKNNRKICHNCLPRVQGDLLQKIFFDKVFLLFHHRALSDIFRSFRRKFDGPVVSTVFCLSNRPLCGEKIFVKSFFPSFLDIDRKIIGLCSKFFRPSWRNCFLQARRINLKTNISFENFLYVFSSFSDFEQTINGFLCRNINSSFVKTAYHLSRRSVGETFLRRGSFLLFIDTWAVFFWHSDKKFCAVSPKLLCVCPLQQIVVKKNFCQKCFSPIFFGDLAKICHLFFETFSVNLTKMHSTSPEDQFEDISLFWQSFSLCFFHVLPNLNRESSVFFSSKNNWKICHNCLPRVQGDILQKFFLTKFFFFFIIGHWATFSCHFYGNLSVPLSVLFSACQMDQFVVKKLLSKNFFPIFFGHWSQN